MDLQVQRFELTGLEMFNIVLGKNGCGKSTLLRTLDEHLRGGGYCRYITPERGGVLNLDGGIENAMQRDGWLPESRRRNRFDQFRQTAATEFRRLETLVLRKIEQVAKYREDANFTFDTIVDQMNGLLDNIEMVRSVNTAFKVRRKGQEEWSDIDTLSSGESELISLAIEVLLFAYMVDQEDYRDTSNWLFLDEPDVHLHPDLQHRLIRLLVTALAGKPGRVLIATHSTSIVSALSEDDGARLALMQNGHTRLAFETIDEPTKAVLPIFGAHPLSNVFNAKPIMLVEGEDDERIWQQAVRTSNGAVKVWPCSAGAVQNLNSYEQKASSVIAAVYDDAIAYSLRDRDDDPYEIEDNGPVKRARLNCRAAENLLLSDDVLALLGSNWDDLVKNFDQWIAEHADHRQAGDFAKFKEGGWDRRNANLKALRNIIMALAGSEKPWEVAIGQGIAGLLNGRDHTRENSLTDFLGPKLVGMLALSPRKKAAPASKAARSREMLERERSK